ncbi:MoaD/ThiS family protein [Candidatus Saccharibacteria bacterium]|nr:MAG: MoaD/ThiS family protein [Candidatus Saccharibacteria bacterium]
MTKVIFSAGLRQVTNGERSTELLAEPPTVSGYIAALDEQYTGFADRVIDAQGDQPEISRHFNIYLNDEDVRYLGGLATVVAADQELAFLIAVAGGSA